MAAQNNNHNNYNNVQPQMIYVPMPMQQYQHMMQMQQQQPMMMQQQPMMMMPQQQQPMMMQQQPMMMQQQPMMQMQYPMMQQPMMQQPMMQQPMMHQQLIQMQQPLIPHPMMQQRPPLIQRINNDNDKNNGIVVNEKLNQIDQIVVNKKVDEVIINKKVEQVDPVDPVDKLEQIDVNEIAGNPVCYKKRKISAKVDSTNKLENLFNNILDIDNDDNGNGNGNGKKKSKRDIAFISDKSGSNVIKTISPVNANVANFDNKLFPNEKYNVTFLNDTVQELSASDINEYTLETQKTIYYHNRSIIPDHIKGTAVIYTRCSIANDISIETQLTKCLQYAKEKDYILTAHYCDNGISGRNGGNFRKGELGFWTKYIDDNTNVIIYSIDRLTRHLLSGIQYLDNLAKRNIDIHFVNNNIIYNSEISAMHKSMVQQELQTAEKYSNDTSEKIKGTLKRLKNDGHVIGKAPYGFSNTIINGIRKRIINAVETANIKKIKFKYIDIIENFDNYQTECVRRSNLSILKYIIRWCKRANIKYRNDQSFTTSMIKSIIS